ncbi:MAG: TIGR03009 domain-containing protein [Pirellulaceae bacterium]
MTRTYLIASLVGIVSFLGSAAQSVVFAQSGETTEPPRTQARYSQPKGGATTGTKGPTYGPAAPRSEQTRPPQTGGQSPVRRTAAEEPLREPVAGPNPEKGTSPKAGVPRQDLKSPAAKPLPLEMEAAPRQPDWFPLAPNVQQWVDEVLVAWEKTSDEIVTFKCSFKRWEHDPAFGPKDPKIPFTFGEGIIQYAKPDKGMFKVEKLLKYSAPAKEGDKVQWLDQIGEQWVCDGRSIFEFSIREKRLYQRILPNEMQGKAIADGPLPFLFGAKVATIKARYWIRPLDPPTDRKGEYWLEAVPKFPRDAANFQRVSIILDEKDFLPKALDVYAPNYNSKTNRAHTEYAFDKRETTLKGDKSLLDPQWLFVWKKKFFEPAVPSGWKKVVEDMNEIPQGPVPVKGPAPGTATRPGTTKTKTK